MSRALRIDALDELAGFVVHQLRNHLQVIAGDAALGAQDTIEAKNRRFEKIAAEVGRSALLVEQLLGLAHPDHRGEHCADLRKVCQDVVQRYGGVLPRSIVFTAELPPVPVGAILDQVGLEYALLNLLLNARHAMPTGGALTLRVETVDDRAVIEMRDTGAGIPQEVVDRVFDPYFTTKPRGEGTGLGLAAVRRFVESANGTVSVESRSGEGSTFRLSFPVAPLVV
ncbi:MAG: HAMP domain-containing sensor histidine kinase [Planctomycetota bacterium]